MSEEVMRLAAEVTDLSGLVCDMTRQLQALNKLLRGSSGSSDEAPMRRHLLA